ncbi:MAG: hypothetical protein BWK79_13910, partial [Beggiatoa sp. IS2]
IHRDELLADWELAVAGEEPFRIPPLQCDLITDNIPSGDVICQFHSSSYSLCLKYQYNRHLFHPLLSEHKNYAWSITPF